MCQDEPMYRHILVVIASLFALAALLGCPPTGEEPTPTATPDPRLLVTVETRLGDVVIELYEDEAPVTVQNFLSYVEEGFYDGGDGLGATLFHRVIPGFMTQGGGLVEGLARKTTHDPIVNESDNGLDNDRGTVSMARLTAPDTATSQFFINVADNDFLNYVSDVEWGYAVFGQVVEGMDVVDDMVSQPTETVGNFQDVPSTPIPIETVISN